MEKEFNIYIDYSIVVNSVSVWKLRLALYHTIIRYIIKYAFLYHTISLCVSGQISPVFIFYKYKLNGWRATVQ